MTKKKKKSGSCRKELNCKVKFGIKGMKVIFYHKKQLKRHFFNINSLFSEINFT